MATASALFDLAPEAAPTRKRTYVFGLHVDTTVPLRAGAADHASDSRLVTLDVVGSDALAAAWRPREATSLVDRRTPRGRLVIAVDVHSELGFRIAAPNFGTHMVSSDGTLIRSALPRVADWRWQRLLFAQVLPLAATLHGLEVFHASAVRLDGRVLAFVASSGTGKTSVAAHLVARGARFITDDVLAVDATEDGVVVHPGAGVMSIDRAELRALRGRAELGVVVGRSDKLQVAIAPVEEALPLSSIYFLDRAPASAELRIDEIEPPEPRLLLASTFISYLRDERFLVNHLDACARIAQVVRMFRVVSPPNGAGGLAEAIAAHAEEAG